MNPEAILTHGGIADQFNNGLSGAVQAFEQGRQRQADERRMAMMDARDQRDYEMRQSIFAQDKLDRSAAMARQGRQDEIAATDRQRNYLDGRRQDGIKYGSVLGASYDVPTEGDVAQNNAAAFFRQQTTEKNAAEAKVASERELGRVALENLDNAAKEKVATDNRAADALRQQGALDLVVYKGADEKYKSDLARWEGDRDDFIDENTNFHTFDSTTRDRLATWYANNPKPQPPPLPGAQGAANPQLVPNPVVPGSAAGAMSGAGSARQPLSADFSDADIDSDVLLRQQSQR